MHRSLQQQSYPELSGCEAELLREKFEKHPLCDRLSGLLRDEFSKTEKVGVRQRMHDHFVGGIVERTLEENNKIGGDPGMSGNQPLKKLLDDETHYALLRAEQNLGGILEGSAHDIFTEACDQISAAIVARAVEVFLKSEGNVSLPKNRSGAIRVNLEPYLPLDSIFRKPEETTALLARIFSERTDTHDLVDHIKTALRLEGDFDAAKMAFYFVERMKSRMRLEDDDTMSRKRSSHKCKPGHQLLDELLARETHFALRRREKKCGAPDRGEEHGVYMRARLEVASALVELAVKLLSRWRGETGPPDYTDDIEWLQCDLGKYLPEDSEFRVAVKAAA